MRSISSLTCILVLISFGLFSCENPTEPDNSQNAPNDGGVHHIAQNHESLYAGNIRYKHQSMVNASASVGVAVNDEESRLVLHVSNDLVIETGSSGTFTLSLNKAPTGTVTVTYPDVEGMEMKPRHGLNFTPEYWDPRVVTVTSTGSTAYTENFTFSARGPVKEVVERTITVTENYTTPQVSISGALSLQLGDTQTVTISLDQAPGAEVVRLDTQIGGATDAFVISPKDIKPFTHANWAPRVLTVSHVGDKNRDAITINIVAEGVITNPITVQLTQKNLQAEISGSENFVDSLYAFMAEGLVQSVGRFLPTQDLVTPFAVSCDIDQVADSRIRFNQKDMTIIQSFDTARCPSLTATASLAKLE